MNGFNKSEVEFAPELKEVKVDVKYFRKFPEWICKRGLIMKLSGNATKIYIILLCFSSINTGVGRVSNKQLAEKSGVSRKHIYKHIKELEDLKLITCITKGWIRQYQIIYKPPYIRDVVLEERCLGKYPKIESTDTQKLSSD